MTRTQSLANELISYNLVKKIGKISISDVKSVKDLKKRLQMNLESRTYDYTYRFIGKICAHYVFKSVDNKKTDYMILGKDSIFVQKVSSMTKYYVTEFSCKPKKELTLVELIDFIVNNILLKKKK